MIVNMKYLNTALISVLILSTVTLLIGQLYEFKFAGGDGHVRPAEITDSNQVSFVQNQPITTSSEYTKIHIQNQGDLDSTGLDVFLSKNSEIVVTDSNPNELTIRLIQGRVILSGSTQVTLLVGDATIRNFDTDNNDSTDSLLHAVFYSWENRLELSAVRGPMIIEQDETKNIRVEAVELNTDASVEREFFEWTNLEF